MKPNDKITKRQIKFGKECSLCKKQPTTGIIDLTEESTHLALCPKHLKDFCKNVIKTT